MRAAECEVKVQVRVRVRRSLRVTIDAEGDRARMWVVVEQGKA